MKRIRADGTVYNTRNKKITISKKEFIILLNTLVVLEDKEQRKNILKEYLFLMREK